jgi:hypothetical protein
MNYRSKYKSLMTKAKLREQRKPLMGYVEKHHIKPRCKGGSNKKSNIAILTAKEHFRAHILLAKIYGGKLWHAAFMMSNMKRYDAKKYEYLRIKHAKIASKIKQSKKTNKARSIALKGRKPSKKQREYSKRPKSKIHRKNISKALKGKNTWSKGKPAWNAGKSLISLFGAARAKKIKKSMGHAGRKHHNYGKHLSQKTIFKIKRTMAKKSDISN